VEPITSKVLPALGIDALENDVTFFTSINTNLTNTQYNNYRRRETYDLPGSLGSITGKQSNKLAVSGKLTYQPNSRLRAVMNFNTSWRRWSDFGWRWTGRPLPFDATPEERSEANHTAVGARDTRNINLRVRHTLSDATYYELRGGYLTTDFKKNLENLAPSDFWFFGPDTLGRNDGEPIPYEESITGPVRDFTGFYSENSFENPWRHNTTERLTLKGDVTSQIHSYHMLKTGVDVKFLNLDYVDIQGGGTQLSPYGRYLAGRGGFGDSLGVAPEDVPEVPPGPYKMFGQNRWVFNANPVKGALYLKDKFERSSLIVNAGVRVDWLRLGDSVFEDDYVNQWCDATQLTVENNPTNPCTRVEGEETDEGNPVYNTDWNKYRYSISPRFGVSFPAFENTQIFFSYGHFSQLPELHYYYRDPYSGAPFTGNPGLGYKQTIKYEFGFRHQFAPNWALDVKTFNRDVSEGIGFTGLQDGSSVSVADNKAFARARGLKFALENRNRLKTHTSGKIDYTVQWAKGYSSSAFNDYRRSQTDLPDPIRERRLGWDVRHQLVFRGTLKSPNGNPLELFGATLPEDWRISTLTRFDSGSPYTPGTIDIVEQQLLHNANTGPMRLNVDLKFRKRFNVFGGKMGFYAEVFNLFNVNNTVVRCGGGTCGWFNQWTGEPVAFGDIANPNNRIQSYYESYGIRSPRQFTQGRRVQLGFQYDF